jgi:hypothetical protein
VKAFLWQALLYLVALLPFGVPFMFAAASVFGKAWGRFPYQPDEKKTFGSYHLPRKHLLCFQYFDTHKPLSSQRRKVKR